MHWTDDLEVASSGCTHKNITSFSDYCPHKGFKREFMCEDCNIPIKYIAGNYITYGSPRVKAEALIVDGL